MQEQAGNLAELVSRFRLGGEGGAVVAQRTRPVPQRIALSR